MSAAGGLIGHLALGVALGLQFNPVTSLVSVVVAAVLAGYPKAPSWRRPLAVAVVAAAWLAGDGARIGARIGTAFVAPSEVGLGWVSIAAWVLVSMLVGYAAPFAAGMLAGRSVVRGTGWLAAGAVAAMVAGAFALLAPHLADGIARLAGGA